jgi:hypothetical protein
VDIDAYDSDENTPLHIAVRMNDISSATVLIAFGANSEKKNLHNQLPLDLAVGSGQLRNMLKRFALKPQFNILQRDRKYTVDPCSQHAADKIGYYLNWRREAHLTLKMEKEIAKLMNQDYINDVTESGKKKSIIIDCIFVEIFSLFYVLCIQMYSITEPALFNSYHYKC